MPYKGLVVGAVQSGKTASMMGVAASCMWTKAIGLWSSLLVERMTLGSQTARRSQHAAPAAMRRDSLTAAERQRSAECAGAGLVGRICASVHARCESVQPAAVERMERGPSKGRAVRRGRQAKNTASLRDLQGALQHLYTSFGAEALPILVFDDECDDASVDSVDTTIPAAIANLWRRLNGATPRAAYVGYTATAAANLLQDAANRSLSVALCGVLTSLPRRE